MGGSASLRGIKKWRVGAIEFLRDFPRNVLFGDQSFQRKTDHTLDNKLILLGKNEKGGLLQWGEIRAALPEFEGTTYKR